MRGTSETTASARAERFFELLRTFVESGGVCARVADVDRLVDEGQPALTLKHDVHDVVPDDLCAFAERERDVGVFGTYYFMAPDHPLTLPVCDFAAQAEAMRTIQGLGHEVGVHLDPYFLMDHLGLPLRDVMTDVIRRFEREGIAVTSGNTHGNSKYKMLDRNGFGTSFDLFDEIRRQPDYPQLEDVPPEVADLIRSNRVALVHYGLTHWADMPLWSARHGFVVTCFITDNLLGRNGTVDIHVHPETVGHYKLAAQQPPGSLTPSPPGRPIPCQAPKTFEPVRTPPVGTFTLDFDSEEAERWARDLAHHPTLFLVHPQHYC